MNLGSVRVVQVRHGLVVLVYAEVRVDLILPFSFRPEGGTRAVTDTKLTLLNRVQQIITYLITYIYKNH